MSACVYQLHQTQCVSVSIQSSFSPPYSTTLSPFNHLIFFLSITPSAIHEVMRVPVVYTKPVCVPLNSIFFHSITPSAIHECVCVPVTPNPVCVCLYSIFFLSITPSAIHECMAVPVTPNPVCVCLNSIFFPSPPHTLTSSPTSPVVRDIKERGRKLDQVLEQYTNLVKPAFEEFTLPVSHIHFQLFVVVLLWYCCCCVVVVLFLLHQLGETSL